MGDPPHPVGAWPEGPFPGSLLAAIQDGAIPESPPPHWRTPSSWGGSGPRGPASTGEPKGSPGRGSLGREGNEKNAIKKKLNILKIYIYRFVFTSSPQIKSSKSTLKQLGGEGGRQREEGNTGGSLQPKCPWRSLGHGKAGRQPQEPALRRPSCLGAEGAEDGVGVWGHPGSPAGSLRSRAGLL